MSQSRSRVAPGVRTPRPTVEWLETRHMLAVGPSLVADLNPTADLSFTLHGMQTVGPLTFLAVDDLEHGIELWKSDGTADGTVLVKDILPGSQGSHPRHMFEVAGRLFFFADDGVSGEELWTSDGTADGTYLVKDVRPGPSSSVEDLLYRSAVAVGNSLYFSADDGLNGSELWVSDGTSNGTVPVINMGPGSASGHPHSLMNVQGTLVFVGTDAQVGNRLWKTNGTAAGTSLCADVVPNTSFHQAIVSVGETIYFQGANVSGQVEGFELWRTNCSPASTTQITHLHGNQSSSPEYLTEVNGQVFFTADDGAGRELWKTDGTEAGTLSLGDIHPFGSAFTAFTQLTNVQGTLFFRANDGTSGRELWRSDGSVAGTTLVKDVRPGIEGSDDCSSLWGTEAGGKFWFTANNGTWGCELWSSDGTTDGTQIVQDLFPGSIPGSETAAPTWLTRVGNQLWFGATDDQHGSGLWSANTSEGSVTLIKDLSSATVGSAPTLLANLQGNLIFHASDMGQNVNTSRKLWRSDGTETVPLSGNLTFTAGHAVVGQSLYFLANDGTHGTELWKTDGTEAGTVLVKDIRPGIRSGVAYDALVNVQGTLYFTANDGTNGFELWKSDGTPDGTQLVEDIRLGRTGSTPTELVNFGGVLYFAASTPEGRELWRSQGTPESTELVKDIAPLSSSSFPSSLTVFQQTLFFVAAQTSGNTELWKSDGTFAGTLLVKEIGPANQGSSPRELTVVEDLLYFVANDGVSGDELWKTDGQEAHTTLVKDIRPGPIGSALSELTARGNQLFFVATDGVHGAELWESDGFEGGTHLVQDLRIGSGDSNPSQLTVVGQSLYFRASDSPLLDLWATDGVQTQKIVGPPNDLAFTYPTGLTNVSGRLYFAATDSLHGFELWHYQPDLAGDLNHDGSVDAADAELAFANWGSSGIGDLTHDGIVDAADMAILFENWTGDSSPRRPKALGR